MESDLLLDRLAGNSKTYASKTAVTFLSAGPDGGSIDKQLTYSELEEKSSGLSSRLLKSGLKAGDRAVLVYPPSLDYMVAFLACLKAGIVAVPVFPPNPARRDTLEMFSRIVQSSGSQHALTSASYNHMKKLAGIKDAVSRFKRSTSKWPENLTWIVTNDGTKTQRSNTPAVKPSRQDVAFLQYTSGSTSAPKGVMITHGNLSHNLTIITNDLKAADDTVVVSWLPQYHDMGLIGSYLGVLFCGGSGYYMSPLTFLQRPMIWIEAVSKYKATHLQAPNFAFKLTSRKCNVGDYASGKLDLSSVRHVINAAEPVTEESIQVFEKTFGQFGFGDAMFPTYGLAEHTVFVCSGGKQRLSINKKELEINGNVVLEDDAATDSSQTSRLVGCGFPENQGVDVRIVDREACEELPPGKVGEIWISSESKAAGYFGQTEESKEDFDAKLKGTSKGYLRTGDLGFFHNKELFICGRLKDLIIVGGRNYYPQDIEATAEMSSPALRGGCSAAFTIDPSRQEGEEVALVAEVRDPPSTQEAKVVCEKLVDGIRAAVNQEHSLSIAEIVLLLPKTVPKTSSGKIARAWCRKAFLASSLKVLFRKSFRGNATSFEIEQGEPERTKKLDVQTIRNMSKKEILGMLRNDIAKTGGVSTESIRESAIVVTLMDSLTLSQFKGLLESHYAVKISDEYLFRESTTIGKLVEVVKLGYAPDDGDGTQAATLSTASGNSGGLAGALGCPPGVVCTIL